MSSSRTVHKTTEAWFIANEPGMSARERTINQNALDAVGQVALSQRHPVLLAAVKEQAVPELKAFAELQAKQST